MKADQAPHEAQSQPEPSLHPRDRPVKLDEWFEEPREICRCDSDSAVAHAQHRELVFALAADLDADAAWGVFQRVVEQIPHHLLQSDGISVHDRWLEVDRELVSG